MALVVKDRIKVTTATTGTGTLTLGSAVTKFQDFSVIGDGNTTYYAIESGNGSDWEIGVGTYTASGTTLSRDTILESSNAGSAINLSGTSTVFCTYPAERSVNTADIGTTIQAYDADTAKYDDATANFTGTLQQGGSNVLTGNQTITLSGDVTGSGTTAITTTVGNDSHSHTTSTLSGNVSAFTNDSGYITGNQTITLSGDATGSGTTAITVTVADNSHSHTSANISDATSANTANTIVERDVSGNFSAGTITAALSGNASTATKWATGRTISLTGDVTGTSASFDGSGNASITATVVDDSHNHIISNVDGLQTALDGKQPIDADLTAIGGLAKTNGNFIVGNGTTWVAESGATARTSLGLGALATLSTVNAATITDNSVGAAELNVSGNGTTSQFLRSDGDGTFTWATPPDTTTNETITLSGDATGSGTTSITVTVVDDSHNHAKLSTASGSAPSYSARAWVNFNGTGTVAIRDSANVSSITDNGTGDYTVNFTTAMPDTNYCFNMSASDDGTTSGQTNGFTYGSWVRGANSCVYNTGDMRFQVGYPANSSLYDQTHINVAIFR